MAFEEITQEQIWKWLQDPETGPWEVLNRISTVSEAEGQSLADFQAWARRLVEIATLFAT